jgi:3-isopropylmalate/(R)-2-methylmalate dehydratase small subunit
MLFTGKVWKFGNDVDTDVIIPVQYTTSTDVKEMAEHCMEGLDPHFSGKVHAGDIIVAGKNFGCGSSREPAPLAIKGLGISCVIAGSFARIFYRNAFNIGLPLLECLKAQNSIEEGEEIEVDLDSGNITNLSRGISLQAKAIPQFMQELIRDGGLMKHIAKQLNNR